MANPAFPVLTLSECDVQSTQYFAAAIQLSLLGATGLSASFAIELPMSATLPTISVTGGSGSTHSVPTTGTPSFTDVDPATLVTVTAHLQILDDTPAVGTRTLTFNVTAPSDTHPWWLVEANNGAGGQTNYTIVNGNNVTLADVRADPTIIVTIPAGSNPFESDALDSTASASNRLEGTVAYSVQSPVGAPAVPTTGATALPALEAQWVQAAPIDVATGLNMPFTTLTPASVTTATPVRVPAPFLAPMVVAPTKLTFGLVGAYFAPAASTPFVTNQANYVDGTGHGGVTVRPRARNLVILVDRTGSMLTQMVITPAPPSPISNYDFAVAAAHVWADLWVAFRTTALSATGAGSATAIVPGDKVGIMVFDDNGPMIAWGTQAPSGPDGPQLVDPSNATAATLFSESDFWQKINSAALTLPSPRGCTPIGDAILAAIDAFGAPADATNDRFNILLMTDGMENCGAVTVDPANPATAISSQWTAGSRASVTNLLTLHTIGLGPNISDSTLNNLPNMVSAVAGGSGSGGGVPQGLYRKVQTPDLLMGAFVEMTLSTLGAQRVNHTAVADNASNANDTLNALYFPVNANEQRLAFAVRWYKEASNNHLNIAYSPQSGAGAGTFTDVTTQSYVTAVPARSTHGMLVVDLANFPLKATDMNWRLQYVGQPFGASSATPQPITGDSLCVVDLIVRADFTLDKPEYQIGDPITVTCVLRAGDAPILHASVRVAIDQPAVGLGTFLATNGKGYVQAPPLTSRQVEQLLKEELRKNPRAASTLRANAADPLHPKAAMLQALLQAKGLDDLPVDHPAAIFSDSTDRLFDDTTHRAGSPNQGVYVNTYTNTAKEGPVTWRFVATGKLANGATFSRTFTVSTWVGVKVDPASSPVSLTLGTTAPTGYLGATIDVLPKSSNGEYLGPFRTGDISFTASIGTLQGSIESTPDGHYRQVIFYKPGDVPVVTVTGQGTPFPPAVVTTNPLCRLWHELPGLLHHLMEEIECHLCGCNHPRHCACKNDGVEGAHWSTHPTPGTPPPPPATSGPPMSKHPMIASALERLRLLAHRIGLK